jgi:type III pantothenate kinase
MLLAIDAGNTNVTFAIFEGDAIKHQWRANSKNPRTSDEWMSWLSSMMQVEEITPGSISGAIISCVVPEIQKALSKMCEDYFCTPLVVGSGEVNIDLKIKTDNPAEVGSDLIVAAVAALKLRKPPFLILDMGTAATITYVDSDGAIAGVIIAPGLSLVSKALSDAASLLPKITIQKPEKILGTSTIPAMQSGLFWGYVDMINGLLARSTEESCVPNLPVIVTGGYAKQMIKEFNNVHIHERDLVLYGLKTIYALNSRVAFMTDKTA